MPKRCQVWGLLSMCAHHPRQIVGRDLLKRSSIVHIKIHKYDQSKPASFWSPLLARQTSFFFWHCKKNSLLYVPEFCRKKTAESVTWTVKKIIVTVPLNGIHGLPQGLGALFQTWLTDYWFLINSTKILSSSSRVLNSELLNSWKPTTLRQKAEFIGLRKNNKDPTMFNFQA